LRWLPTSRTAWPPTDPNHSTSPWPIASRVDGPFLGSSHFPGERGLDFQEEVARVAKSIGHALDDLDAVVHSLDEAGVHWKARAGEDAPGVSAQVAGKALQRRQATGPRMSQPRSPA